MSNVALHMFPDAVTRALFAAVGRLVRPGGLFLFHVSALEDRPAADRHANSLSDSQEEYVTHRFVLPVS